MALNENQKKTIEPKLSTKCPLCGGHILHHTTPAQIFFNEYDSNTRSTTIDVNKATFEDYLVGECQNCGYTILRKLDILLKDSQ